MNSMWGIHEGKRGEGRGVMGQILNVQNYEDLLIESNKLARSSLLNLFIERKIDLDRISMSAWKANRKQ